MLYTEKRYNYNMVKKNNRRSWSIRSKLISMILLCLVLSIGVMGFYSYFYYTRSISNKLQDAVKLEATSMTSIAVNRIENIIDISRDITYEADIENIIVGNQREEYGETLFNEYMDKSLQREFYAKSYIMFVGIITTDNPNNVYYYDPTGNDYLKLFQDNIMEIAQENMYTNSTGIQILSYDGYIYIIRNLFSMRDMSKLGTIVLQCKDSYFFHQFETSTVWSEGLVYSINGNEQAYGKTSTSMVHDIEYVEQNMQCLSEGIFCDDKMLYVVDSIKTDDLLIKCMSFVNQNKVYSSSQDIFSITVLLIVLIVPCIVIILFQVYKSISVPIDKMVDAMKSVEHGNFGVTYEYEKNDEFKYLFDSFNHMTEKMETLIDNLYKEELASKDAKIMALQSQINPHFLNNTLEMLLWKARTLGSQEIEGMLEALCVIFNASMDRSSKRFVQLSEEIEYVAAYLYISEKRFKEKLAIVEHIDDSLHDILIPRLTIQPLMENAIKHGIEPIGSGTVWVSINASDDVAIIKIINNGKMLTDDDAQRINDIINGTVKVGNRTSLGIRNLNERIKLLYGEEYGLTVYRDEQYRTVSRLVIPILKNDGTKGE